MLWFCLIPFGWRTYFWHLVCPTASDTTYCFMNTHSFANFKAVMWISLSMAPIVLYCKESPIVNHCLYIRPYLKPLVNSLFSKLFSARETQAFSVSIPPPHDEADPQLLIYLFLFLLSLPSFRTRWLELHTTFKPLEPSGAHQATVPLGSLVLPWELQCSWNFQRSFYQGKAFRIHLILRRAK